MSNFEDRYRTWHTWISYIKSAVRMATSAIALVCALYVTAGAAVIALAVGYFIAEMLGIAEEFV
jgi:hypothetical protein